MIGLYAHLPFCRKKCHYCNFIIRVSSEENDHRRFLQAFKAECDHEREAVKDRVFDTLYLGGGTPSLMTEESLTHFFRIVKDAFRIREDAEITCEANPADLTLKKAVLLKGLGVGRVSLGVQSFNDRTLASINRDHKVADIRCAVDYLRRAGIQNISCDLILALPEESPADTEHSLMEAVKLGFEHFSIYELAIEEGTVFGALAKKGELKLPEDPSALAMTTFARRYLEDHGYDNYELLSYAKPGFYSRHNLIYWNNWEYLGLGPGAFSYIKGRRYQIANSVETYFTKAQAGDWLPVQDEHLEGIAKERESFLLRLRLKEGAPVQDFKQVVSGMRTSLAELEKKGWIELSDDRVRLTPEGKLWAETVFSELSLPD